MPFGTQNASIAEEVREDVLVLAIGAGGGKNSLRRPQPALSPFQAPAHCPRQDARKLCEKLGRQLLVLLQRYIRPVVGWIDPANTTCPRSPFVSTWGEILPLEFLNGRVGARK
jgi:hypothetical protein